jgi:DNA-directed RNA polymerase subunit RPC12/RpoP
MTEVSATPESQASHSLALREPMRVSVMNAGKFALFSIGAQATLLPLFGDALTPFRAIWGAVSMWALMLWIRRREITKPVPRPANDVLPPAAISRAEFTQRIDSFLAQHAPVVRQNARLMMLGLTSSVGLFVLAANTGNPENPWVVGGSFVGFWGFVTTMFFRDLRQLKRAAAATGLLCPSCDKPIIDSEASLTMIDLIEESRRCPHCGTRIIREESR